MSSYKLVYANARGRAELIRLIFAYVEQPYEDVRIAMTDLQAERASQFREKENKLLFNNCCFLLYICYIIMQFIVLYYKTIIKPALYNNLSSIYIIYVCVRIAVNNVAKSSAVE